MSNRDVYISSLRVIDSDVRFQESTLADNTLNQTVLTEFKCKHGKKARIVAFRQAWSAALDTYLTMHLVVNGIRKFPYHATLVQIAAPESDNYLPVPIDVEQGANITVLASVTGAGATGTATAVVVVEYYDEPK